MENDNHVKLWLLALSSRRCGLGSFRLVALASGASELLAPIPPSFFQPLHQPQAVLFEIDCLELCLLLHSFNLAFSLFQSAVD